MKVTCGTDIIEISRIQESIETMGEKFIQRVYTQDEISYCEGRGKQKYQHYAARFAAKEAVFKAISVLLNDKYSISWKDIEIRQQIDGNPLVCFKTKYEQIDSIDLSLSHCKQYAVATVVMLYH